MKAKTTTAFDALNPPQRKVAAFGPGPLLVLGGAGSGKTHALAHRIAHLALDGVDPARILLLTFSRRASREIIERAQAIVTEILSDRGKLGDRSVASRLIWCGTFYAVAGRIVRRFAKHLGLDPAFTVLDRAAAGDLMDGLRHELGLSSREKGFLRKDACLAIYSSRVNRRLPLKQILEEQFSSAREFEADLTRLYREYVARKQRNFLLDADDLLLYWHTMMQNPALAQGLGRNFDHVLADDYQDASTLQVEILQALKPDGSGVTVAGDDTQAIYPFRAAASDTILGFAKRFTPPAETCVLAQNYRSTQRILDCANALMAEGERAQRKMLFGTRPASHRPLHVSLEDAAAQAEYIAGRILSTREAGGAFKRHAVLLRHPQHGEALEAEFDRRKIPYVRYGGREFLEDAHVQDVLSLLRWADNPRNSIAGIRTLKRVPGIGSDEARRACDLLAAGGCGFKSLATFKVPPPVEMDWRRFCGLMEKLADPATPWSGQMTLVREWYKPQLERLYDSSWDRIRDLERLEQLSARYPDRERFLTELALDPPALAGGQTPQKDEDCVTVSTLQSAKGREWDIVYVLNVADGSLPSRPAADSPGLLEEERRLLYVAMTRTRNELHLCSPGSSRFLDGKVAECVERTSYRSLRGAENLQAAGTVSVDVAAKLKEMW